MPFDPKLICPDEPPLSPAGEIELPGDLAALAEQLGDDAAHLAKCYPAAHSARAASLAATKLGTGRTLNWKRWSALATTAVAMLLLVAVAFQQFTQHNRPSQVTTAPVPPAVTAAPTVSPIAAPAIHPVSTTITLTDLSGPELEAVFDLRERSGDEGGSISF